MWLPEWVRRLRRNFTAGVDEHLAVDEWRGHRFGLSAARWAGLHGLNIWITGAGTGFGRSIAVALSLAGARVFLTGRRSAKLEETAGEAEALGADRARCCVVSADITDPASVEQAAQAIAAQSDLLHGVVHSAALPQHRITAWPLAQMDPDQWNRLLATNVTGQWMVCRAALPLLIRGPSLKMIFLSSEAGWASTPGVGAYNVTKAALNSLGASLAMECAQRFPAKDVQINVLNPGEARTEMNAGSTQSPYSVVPMTLLLLSHPAGGPNGRFFHRDGRHLAFSHSEPFPFDLRSW